MIHGVVNQSCEAILPVVVKNDTKTQLIDAVIDTGFSGFLTLPSTTITALELAWKGRNVATLGDGTSCIFEVYIAVVIWDGQYRTIETGSWVYRLVWSPSCNHLAFNLGRAVQIWDADRAEVVTNLPGAATPQDLRWSPDGHHLAVATKNDIHIWNSHNWDARLYQWELNSPASTLAWSPDGAYLACAIHDHSIGVLDWSAEDGWIVLWQAAVEAVQVLDGAEDGFCCLAWHPTGCRLAAGGRRGELFVWSVCG